MRILACLKQVSEPETPFDLKEGRIDLRPPARFKMSALDEFALEEALRLKDARPGAELWALTMGPPRAAGMLQRALGMGADQGAHLLAEEEPPPRPLQIAAAIAAWAQERAFDLILTGVMSEDAMQGSVGPMLAALLDLPWATAVVEMEADPAGRRVRVVREMEAGQCQELELPLPALLTIQSSGHQPRYPSLSNLLRAKRTPLLTQEAAGLAAPPAQEACRDLGWPQRQRAGLVLAGSTQEKAARLCHILRERALL